MGQTYYVKLVLKYEDDKPIISAAKDFIMQHHKNKTARFDKRYGFDTLKGIVKSVLAEFQGGFEEYEGGIFISEFDATYSWESVLDDFFQVIRPFLRKGSRLEVYPDDSFWIEEVS